MLSYASIKFPVFWRVTACGFLYIGTKVLERTVSATLLKMGASYCAKTSISVYQTTRPNIPENRVIENVFI